MAPSFWETTLRRGRALPPSPSPSKDRGVPVQGNGTSPSPSFVRRGDLARGWSRPVEAGAIVKRDAGTGSRMPQVYGRRIRRPLQVGCAPTHHDSRQCREQKVGLDPPYELYTCPFCAIEVAGRPEHGQGPPPDTLCHWWIPSRSSPRGRRSPGSAKSSSAWCSSLLSQSGTWPPTDRSTTP